MPAIPAPLSPPPEITNLIERGCYRCLEQALKLAVEHEHRDPVHDRPDESGENERIVAPDEAGLLLLDQ